MTKESAAFDQASKALYANLVTVVNGLATMEPKESSAWIVDQNWPTSFDDYLISAVAKKKLYNQSIRPFNKGSRA